MYENTNDSHLQTSFLNNEVDKASHEASLMNLGIIGLPSH